MKIFSIPGDCQALLGMLDIELLNVLKIMCKVMSYPHQSRKFNSQTIEASSSSSCRIESHITRQTMCMHSTYRGTDKRASEVWTYKIHNEYSDVVLISGIGCLQVKDDSLPYQAPHQKDSIHTTGTP